MARDNNHQMQKLRLLFQMDNKKSLAEETRKMSKQINQRFYRLEKQGLATDSYAYQVAQRETDKNKPRYSESVNKLEKLPIDTLYQEGLDIYAKLFSKTSTIRGVKQVQEKRIEKAVEVLEEKSGLKISKKDFKSFIDYGGGEFLNSKYLDSKQIIEDLIETTKDGNVSIKEFIREFKRFKSIQQRTYPKIKRNLSNLLSRKRSKTRNNTKRKKK